MAVAGLKLDMRRSWHLRVPAANGVSVLEADETARRRLQGERGIADLAVVTRAPDRLTADGFIVSYLWKEGQTVLSESSSASTVTTLPTGSHTIDLEVTDNSGLTASDTVVIEIEPRTLTSVSISPSFADLLVGDQEQFSAMGLDQQGNPMPTSFVWSASGGGSVDSAGLFTASVSGGPFYVTASADGVSNSASVNVTVSVDQIIPTPTIVGTEVQYQANSDADYLLYNWSFGDNTPETGFGSFATIQHTFTEARRYIVVLTILDPNTGQEWNQTFLQLVYQPPTENQPGSSKNIMVLRDGSAVWNTNPDNDTVTSIDTATPTVLAEIPVAGRPVSLAQAPDGSVWVVNKDSALISVIDPADPSPSVIDSIALPHGSRPHGIVFNSTHAFVALEATGQIFKLNATNRVEEGSLNLDPASATFQLTMMAVCCW